MKGHALIHSGKWEGHNFFRKKFLKFMFCILTLSDFLFISCLLRHSQALEVIQA